MSRRNSVTTSSKSVPRRHSVLQGEALQGLPEFQQGMPTDRDMSVALLTGGPPWGFRISGGSEFYETIRISHIKPMGLADRSKALRVGDQIVTINEKSVEGLPHKGVERMISTPAYTITLGVVRNHSLTRQKNMEVGVQGLKKGALYRAKVLERQEKVQPAANWPSLKTAFDWGSLGPSPQDAGQDIVLAVDARRDSQTSARVRSETSGTGS